MTKSGSEWQDWRLPNRISRKDRTSFTKFQLFSFRFPKKALYAVLLLSLVGLGATAYAINLASQQQNGHIRIVNGSNAGILVSPAFLDFGNVTWGTTITVPINVTNTGSCVEHVIANATQTAQPNKMVEIPRIFPNHTTIVDATYDTTVFQSPGDYTFAIEWTADCIV